MSGRLITGGPRFKSWRAHQIKAFRESSIVCYSLLFPLRCDAINSSWEMNYAPRTQKGSSTTSKAQPTTPPPSGRRAQLLAGTRKHDRMMRMRRMAKRRPKAMPMPQSGAPITVRAWALAS